MDTKASLAEDGFEVIEPVLNDTEIDPLLEAVVPLESEWGNAGRGGLCNVLERVPALAELVRHPAIRKVVVDGLGPGAFAVRGRLFDKQVSANWKVAWHQDLTVCVREERPVPGYGPWAVKAGVPHVQPPIEVLEQMLAVRVHLDACGVDNGPLRVIPGSHRRGRLGPFKIKRLRASGREVTCVVERGGLLLMRPLLLHASAPAARPSHRRVVHIEFACCELAGGLEWAERRPCD